MGLNEKHHANISFAAAQNARRLAYESMRPSRENVSWYYHAVGCCIGLTLSEPLSVTSIEEMETLLPAISAKPLVLAMHPLAPEERSTVIILTTDAEAFNAGVHEGTKSFVLSRSNNPGVFAQIQAHARANIIALSTSSPHNIEQSYWRGVMAGCEYSESMANNALKQGVESGCRLFQQMVDFDLLMSNVTRDLAITECLPYSSDNLHRKLYLTALKMAIEQEKLRKEDPTGYAT